MLRRYTHFALMLTALAVLAVASPQFSAHAAQDGGNAKQTTTANEGKNQEKSQAKKPSAPKTDSKDFTPEQVVEGVIIVYGTRGNLQQIRRNGIENGRFTRIGPDGRTEEAVYVRRFVRGDNSEKDRVRIDQKLPTVEYSLVYGDGRLWGIINGSAFTPRQEATVEFQSQLWHGLDALLRYKENGSTIALAGKETHGGVEFYIIDLTDKDKRRTRYYASTKTLRVMWLEYEEVPVAGGSPVKFMRRFYDYRPAQGTLVPYRTVFYEDGRQSQETRIQTVTYGIRMEDSLFQNPESPQTNTNARQ